MSKYSIDDLINRYPLLQDCKNDIELSVSLLVNSFKNNKKLLIAGNGGSSADAEHIAGELIKGFKSKRPISKSLKDKIIEINKEKGEELTSKLQGALPVISLSNHQSLNTAFINDVPNGGEYCFAQQVLAYGNKDDVFLAISTSGNSKNILDASIVAKALGLKVIALTGNDGGELKKYADVSIVVPLRETFMIQEHHLPIYHYICLRVEEELFCEQ